MIKIGIIGTAGRGDNGKRLTKDVYIKMYEDVLLKVKAISEKNEITLVSGGAAWSDHLAISLFLADEVRNLQLWLPCKFQNGRFENNKTGQVANYYHEKFSDRMGRSTLLGIKKAIDKGAEVFVRDGFLTRNKDVARESEHLIAYTFGEGNVPADGGTKHTWDHCKSINKIHVSIQKLV